MYYVWYMLYAYMYMVQSNLQHIGGPVLRDNIIYIKKWFHSKKYHLGYTDS